MSKRKIHPHSVPTVIRGVLYPSMSAAARDLGVTLAAVQGAMDRGTLDNVGVGTNTLRKKPVICNGVYYESIQKLSESIPWSARRLSGILKEKNGNATLTKDGIEYHIHFANGYD